MNKRDFEKELEQRLSSASADERKRVLDYYSELYDEKYELGLREEEIIKSFGNPDKIAADVLGESVFNRQVQKVKDRTSSLFSKKSFLMLYFALFFITIPMTIALLSLVLAAGIIMASGIFTVILCGVVFVVAGPVYAGFGVYTMISTDAAAGLAQVGVGFGILAAGLLLFLFIRFLNYLRIVIFVKKSKKPQAIAKVKSHKKLRLGTTIACVVAFVLGGALVTGGLGMAGWDYRRLDTTVYSAVTEPEYQEFDTIKIDTKTRTVKLFKTDGDFKIDAYNYNASELTITIEDGVLLITEKFKLSAHDIGNAFNFANPHKRDITIYLPQDIAIVNMQANAGDLLISGLTLEQVEVKCKNADVQIEKSTIAKVAIELTNGDINIKTSTIPDLKAAVKNGDMRIDLKGQKSEYNIITSTRNGGTYGDAHKNQSVPGSDKKVELEVINGDIRLSIKV